MICVRPLTSAPLRELRRHIRGGQATLGIRLLDRTPEGVETPPYGRALLKRSLAVFDELRQGVKEIESLADPGAGELRIGLTEVPAAGMVPLARQVGDGRF